MLPPVWVGLEMRWLVFGYMPNEWASKNLWDSSARFNFMTTGRQVGKSEEAAKRIDAAMNAPPDPRDVTGDPLPFVGVIGPTYEKAEISVFKYIESLAKAFGTGVYRLNQNKHELTIIDPIAGIVGAKLKWMSAEDAFNSVGFTFSHVLGDECQAIPDEVYFKLRPTMDVRYAGGDFFGTPDITKQQSWFQGGWQRGQDPLDADYHSFTIASWDAGWMSAAAIADAKKQLPEAEFRRLYGGEWVADTGLVFTSVDQALLAKVPEYDPKRRYLMSVDFAVYDDFNAVFIGDVATRTVIYHDRWNLTDPLVTYDRLEEIWERFGKPRVWADETGAGVPMVRDLRARKIPVSGVTWGAHTGAKATSKLEAVQQLAADIQHRRIMFPDWDDLRREMSTFVYSRTPAGNLTASAASGAHDDLVMSLALLNLGFRTRGQRDSEEFQSNYLRGRRAAA